MRAKIVPQKKVSFDFDETLEFKPIMEYARELIDRGIEVWIVTSRFGNDELYKRFFHTSTNVDLTNRDLWEVANNLGIPEERVHFTNKDNKWHFIKDKGFIWHLDDDYEENKLILKHCAPTKAIGAFNNPKWKWKCEKILKKAEI